jgi:thiol-disulfide isomerase/thioredoxin
MFIRRSVMRNKMVRLAGLTLLSVLGMAGNALAQTDNIQAFGTTSFAQFKTALAGRPFVVSLWSIDCLPCRVELELLGNLKQSDPEFPLLLISTDSIEKHEEASDILEQYGLHNIDSWMFADAFVERLRFSIDPGWYGELPRSYFYAADHSFKAHSGILTAEKMDELFPR